MIFLSGAHQILRSTHSATTFMIGDMGFETLKNSVLNAPGYIIRLIDISSWKTLRCNWSISYLKLIFFMSKKLEFRYLLFYKIIVQNKTFSSSLLREYTIYNSTFIYSSEKRFFFSYLVIKKSYSSIVSTIFKHSNAFWSYCSYLVSLSTLISQFFDTPWPAFGKSNFQNFLSCWTKKPKLDFYKKVTKRFLLSSRFGIEAGEK